MPTKKTQTETPRRIEYMPIDELRGAEHNPKGHDKPRIANSISRFGFADASILDERTGRLVAGHGRHGDLLARKDQGKEPPEGVVVDDDGRWLMPVQRGWASRSDEDAQAFLVAHNRLTETGGWDEQGLLELLEGINDVDPELLDLTGYTEDDIEALGSSIDLGGAGEGGDGAGDADAPSRTLVDRFGAPPFTVLNARQGPWQERKRAWTSLGIESEIGRDGDLVYDSAQRSFTNWYDVKTAAEVAAGRKLTEAEVLASPEAAKLQTKGGTSIFDPALCELLYHWYTTPGDRVTDPWAGGSVRGIVAARMGRDYTGHELRPEQVDANRAQGDAILRDGDGTCEWIGGDSRATLRDREAGTADFVIGCPPYYDLEKYSDDEADLSTLSTEEFDAAMVETVTETARVMADNRFAAFIVGNVRDGQGRLRSMHALMVRACAEAGLDYVQDAVLLTPIGSVRTTSARAFLATRSLGRVHQEVMIFCKGDRKAAAARLGEVDLGATIDALAELEQGGGDDDEEGDQPRFAVPPSAADYTPDLTPVEEYDGIWVKREDLWTRGGASGGKSRAMFTATEGAAGLITAGSRNSAQIERGALVARALGVPARIHTGHGRDTPEIATCRAAGATVLQAKPARLTVIRARFRDDVDAHPGWASFPFGMDSEVYLRQVARQVENVPAGVSRVVVPYGSGMTLAGVLRGLAAHGRQGLPVLAVSVGQGSHDYLDRYAPGWRARVDVVEHPSEYSVHARVTRWRGVQLDPVYEAKCVDYLRPGDLLWTVGLRTSAEAGR